MKTVEQIKVLVKTRLEEAEVLCNAGKYDGAFYLAGYSVELMLKAKVCEKFGFDDLFDESPDVDKELKTPIGEVKKSIKTHNLSVLLIYTGLVRQLQLDKVNNPKLMQVYGYLMSIQGNNQTPWSEQARYLPIGSQKEVDVKAFIQSLKDNDGLLKWIENN